jgi:uncharacterized RDD family membrane protein YckC
MTTPSGTADPGGIEHNAEGARQVVHSPEQVVLHLPVAGPASRILAYAIDYLVILLVQLAIFTLVILILSSMTNLVESLRGPVEAAIQGMDTTEPDTLFLNAAFWLAFLLLLLIQLAAEWSYFVFSEMASGGRSLGKRVAGLRVVRDGGLPITFRASAVRNLLRIVDYLPTSYLVGLTSIVVSPEGKRLGDMAAGTLVVRLDRPAPAPPILDEQDESEAGFRFGRDQIARIGRKERALVRQTLRRIESLDENRREAVLERVVEVLRGRIDYEPVEEQLRLDFLRALFRASSRVRS